MCYIEVLNFFCCMLCGFQKYIIRCEILRYVEVFYLVLEELRCWYFCGMIDLEVDINMVNCFEKMF